MNMYALMVSHTDHLNCNVNVFVYIYSIAYVSTLTRQIGQQTDTGNADKRQA